MRKSLIQQFETRYIPEPNTGCWLWTGELTRDGYGMFYTPQRRLRAHRLSYELFCEAIPEDLNVLHRCDNPPCVNPAHLFLGTRGDNNLDKVRKGRSAQMRGTKNVQAKLTEADVRDIRNCGESNPVLGKRYGLSIGTVSDIKNRKKWAHLD